MIQGQLRVVTIEVTFATQLQVGDLVIVLGSMEDDAARIKILSRHGLDWEWTDDLDTWTKEAV